MNFKIKDIITKRAFICTVYILLLIPFINKDIKYFETAISLLFAFSFIHLFNYFKSDENKMIRLSLICYAVAYIGSIINLFV